MGLCTGAAQLQGSLRCSVDDSVVNKFYEQYPAWPDGENGNDRGWQSASLNRTVPPEQKIVVEIKDLESKLCGRDS